MITRAALTRRFGGLGVRLMAVMGLALLPLALLSYVQGLETLRLSEGRITSAIKGETLISATPLISEIVKAQGKAAALAAAVPSVLRADAAGDQPGCRAMMEKLVEANVGLVTFAGFASSAGQMTCGSARQALDLSASSAFQEMLDDPKPRLMVNPFGPVSRTSVLIFSHPVSDDLGRTLGVVFVSLPHQALVETRPQPVEGRQPVSLITFQDNGTILTSSSGMEDADRNLPATRSLEELAQSAGESFVAETLSGQRRAFAVVPLQDRGLFLLGSWPANRLQTSMLEGAIPAFVFPSLMWAASLLVAWLAAESQVLRHVRHLRDRITAFAAGERQASSLSMTGAALELQFVGRAYQHMTEAVMRNEAALENTIHQKEVLLREVHHRVKNNLQLIASIMNMQLRSARSAEAKEAMRNVQDRVISLATVHRELYQTSGLTDVRADELLPRVATDLLRIGTTAGRSFDLEVAVEDIRLTPDQAVPLALFLTEGMANVIKHAWSEGAARSRVGLRLERRENNMARFSLCNTLVPSDANAAAGWTEGSDGFGSQLLNAFSTQLSGTVTRGREGDGYVLSLDFALRPLSEGRGPGGGQGPGRPVTSFPA